MFKKWCLFIFVLILFLTACSNNDSSELAESTADEQAEAPQDFSMANKEDSRANNLQTESAVENDKNANDSSNATETEVAKRKIIYNASLTIETSNFTEATKFIEEETLKKGGYIVSSQASQHQEEKTQQGSMTVRIPAKQFQSFLTILDEGNMKVQEKAVSGEDVTEQYVDLTARLEAKEVVEKRLLSFMEKAEKTEDLLKISADLAEVQEEIEQLTGKIKYLENQSDFATIDLFIKENNTSLPSVQNESASTWEKTKEQFKESIQFLVTLVSTIFVFLIGNAPIIVLLLIIFVITIVLLKRRKKKKPDTN